MEKKRKVDILVLSDIHLGTYGCKADELLNYLHSIDPQTVILNGDIIDMWQFSKSYFPMSHMKVIKYITSKLSKGVRVHYITGNHDEMLRKFKGFSLGNFEIVNKLILEIDGKSAWFFHGDVFDVTMKHSKWLAKLGGKGYDLLIIINTMVNWISESLGKGRISFSKQIKKGVKGAVSHINNFESIVSNIAIENNHDFVACGHIHEPIIKEFQNESGKKVTYLNSGDWVESMTSLEYVKGQWKIYSYSLDKEMDVSGKKATQGNPEDDIGFDAKALFQELLNELNPV